MRGPEDRSRPQTKATNGTVIAPCPILPQPIVAIDGSNRRISSEPNVQQIVERQFADAKGLGRAIGQHVGATRFTATWVSCLKSCNAGKCSVETGRPAERDGGPV